jgi:hypothetical protein
MNAKNEPARQNAVKTAKLSTNGRKLGIGQNTCAAVSGVEGWRDRGYGANRAK